MADNPNIPVYVKIDDYKDVLDIINLIKHKLGDAQQTLGKINELKKQEDHELELWGHTLDEIERKVDFIDKSLFEPK